MNESTHQYDDIINLPHHVSKKHPPLTMKQRAAQFAPFKAVAGQEEAIRQVTLENEKKYE